MALSRVPAAPFVSTQLKRPLHAGCCQPYHRARRIPVRAGGVDDLKGADEGLSGVFSQFVFLKGIKSPAAAAQRVNPSPLLPPTAVLEQVMNMLQRNDWPEPDTGVQGAFNLTLPATSDEEAGAVRSWKAEEEWLPWQRFHALLHVSYNPLINCDSWRAISPLVFPSARYDSKAVQAVEVRARPHHPPPSPDSGVDTALRTYTYTFCWERVDSGSCKDCWLIAGVRVGNYAL